jgi:hypothetical protein
VALNTSKVGSEQWAVGSEEIKAAHCSLPTARYFLKEERWLKQEE